MPGAGQVQRVFGAQPSTAKGVAGWGLLSSPWRGCRDHRALTRGHGDTTAWNETLRLVTSPFENCRKMHFQEVLRSPSDSPRDGSWEGPQQLLVNPAQPSFPSGSPWPRPPSPPHLQGPELRSWSSPAAGMIAPACILGLRPHACPLTLSSPLPRSEPSPPQVGLHPGQQQKIHSKTPCPHTVNRSHHLLASDLRPASPPRSPRTPCAPG